MKCILFILVFITNLVYSQETMNVRINLIDNNTKIDTKFDDNGADKIKKIIKQKKYPVLNNVLDFVSDPIDLEIINLISEIKKEVITELREQTITSILCQEDFDQNAFIYNQQKKTIAEILKEKLKAKVYYTHYQELKTFNAYLAVRLLGVRVLSHTFNELALFDASNSKKQYDKLDLNKEILENIDSKEIIDHVVAKYRKDTISSLKYSCKWRTKEANKKIKAAKIIKQRQLDRENKRTKEKEETEKINKIIGSISN